MHDVFRLSLLLRMFYTGEIKNDIAAFFNDNIEIRAGNNFVCLGENYDFYFQVFLRSIQPLPQEHPVIRVGCVLRNSLIMAGIEQGKTSENRRLPLVFHCGTIE